MASPTVRHPSARADAPILVIGAGPSGLAAAYRLHQRGCQPLIVERSRHVGGMMRSIVHGDYVVDLGRKELYARIPEVDAFWHELLEGDYRAYPHRVGSLYGGRVLEMSSRFRGIFRGMPLPLLAAGGADLGRAWIAAALRPAANYEDYWYRRAGRRFARAFAQGYWEKFRGQCWREMAVPVSHADGGPARAGATGALADGLTLAAEGGPSGWQPWKHPARGSGQICERLAEHLRGAGVEIGTETEVVKIACHGDRVGEVITAGPTGIVRHRPEQVVSSLQIEALAALLQGPGDAEFRIAHSVKRSVVLVYLFLGEAPRFPHAWLEVNDPALACGRITNYAAFGGDMVPAGKTALCVEFFLDGEAPPQRSDEEWMWLAGNECARNALIDRTQLEDALVLRLDRCNAAASWRETEEVQRRRLLDAVRPLRNLYHVNRPGTDWATFAGLLAGEAIASGDRRAFDLRADLTRSHAESEQLFRLAARPEAACAAVA